MRSWKQRNTLMNPGPGPVWTPCVALVLGLANYGQSALESLRFDR
jgi:hypothetical protein